MDTMIIHDCGAILAPKKNIKRKISQKIVDVTLKGNV